MSNMSRAALQARFERTLNNPGMMAMRRVRGPAPTSARGRSFLPTSGIYAPSARGMTQDQADFAKAYVNGMHDNNYARNPGAPAGPGLRRVLRHSKMTVTMQPGADGVLSFVVTGMPEAPIIRVDGGAVNARVYPWPNMPWSGNTTTAHDSQANDWFKDQGVEAYRCADLAYKIEDASNMTVTQGTIKSTIVPPGIDLVPIMGVANNNRYNARVIDCLCEREEEMDKMTDNAYTDVTKNGAYRPIPTADWTFPYMYRDCPDHKAVYSAIESAADINTGIKYYGNCLAIQSQYNGALIMPTKGETPNSSALATGLIPVHPSTMCTASVWVSGLAPATETNPGSVLKVFVTSTWELLISTHSTLQDLRGPQCPTDVRMLQFVTDVMRVMPDAYRADANDWNDIWTKAKSIWSDYVSPFAGKVISSLPPEYAAIGAGAKAALDMVTDTKKATDKAVAAVTSASKSAISAVKAASSNSGRH